MPDKALEQVIEVVVTKLLDQFMNGFEDRLAVGMTKALDTVTANLNDRLRGLEEDQARILRHLGLDAPEPPAQPEREII